MTTRKREWLTGGAIVTRRKSQVDAKLILPMPVEPLLGEVRLLGRNRMPIAEAFELKSPAGQFLDLFCQRTWPSCPRLRRLEQILGPGDYAYGTASIELPPALWQQCSFISISLRYDVPDPDKFPRGEWHRAADTVYVEINKNSLFMGKVPTPHHCFLMTPRPAGCTD